MEEKELNVSFYKAGGGVSTRINLPKKWTKDMEIVEDDKTIIMTYDEEKKTITISKKK